jgi:hypothetical protein
MDTARVTFQPRTKQASVIVLYGAINTAKLDVSNLVILDKIFSKKRDTINISIPKNYLEKK